MESLPDEDQAPLEPPETLLPFDVAVPAPGRHVIVLPSSNPSLGPELDVAGLPGLGWHLRVRDAFGTVVFTLLLKCDDEVT